MSYEEKGQWVYLAVTVIGYGAYVVLSSLSAGTRPLTEVDYEPILLWTIGAAIAASIIGRIAIEIVWHERVVHERTCATATSAGAASTRPAWSSGIGMVVPFILALVEADYFWIANAMYLVFALASIVSRHSS